MKTFQNITRRIGFCAVLACTGLQTPLQAKITLPAFFTDNMIIQQQTTMTLFGKAKPNKKVSIETSWNNQHYETKADAQGNWQVAVSTPTAGGPYRITLSDGKKTVLENVMAGEVWFCSGQSNMEMPVAGWGKIKNYEQEIAAADYPGIRLFQEETHFRGSSRCLPSGIHHGRVERMLTVHGSGVFCRGLPLCP